MEKQHLTAKLEVENLSKVFGKNTILKDINFSVKDGEIISILRRVWMRENDDSAYFNRP